MIKVLMVVVLIIGVGFIAYNEGVKNAPTQQTEVVDTEKPNDTVPTPDALHTNTDVVEKETVPNTMHVLDLSNTGLTQTPRYVFDEVATEKLDLSHNKLTGSLQAEIRHLQNLTVLDLSDNQFTGVPAEIGQLKNLEVLDLSNNSITGLPLELGNLSNLKMLNLKGNAYAKIDLERIKETLPSGTMIQVD